MSGRQLRSNSSKRREGAHLEEHLRTLDRLTHNLHLLDQIARSQAKGHPAPQSLINQLSHNQQRQEKIQEERREYMQRLKEKQKRGFYTQGTRLQQEHLRDLREQLNAAKALANEVYGKETPTRTPPPPTRLPQPPAHPPLQPARLPAPPQIIHRVNQEIVRRQQERERVRERELKSARQWAERRHLKQRQSGAPRPAAPSPVPHPVPRPAAPSPVPHPVPRPAAPSPVPHPVPQTPQERRPRSTQELRALNRTWSGNRIPNSTTRSGRKWKE